ncbi:MAG: hypothetical protein AAF526_01535 [Pseudomonadota bacterium]
MILRLLLPVALALGLAITPAAADDGTVRIAVPFGFNDPNPWTAPTEVVHPLG